MSTVIKVENLSKAYQLGEIGTGTLSRDLERWFARIRGKEDPFLRIGETNDRSQKGESDVVWSLKDINFEVQQGDVLGIIGRNGAGKSTLLKILSRITAPSSGSVKVKGRIASLLEVGTGFHPELTGRENIYLNGAILGMRKREIDRKIDEIIDFSGVERYIDTPVKRYSSGMYVRLAFAVAAHLESEILIVDEVLAVGDAEFQKKCLGKMSEVSKGEGKTVLFVSHNMGAVRNLCENVILMEKGEVKFSGITNDCLSEYSKNQYISDYSLNLSFSTNRSGTKQVTFEDFYLENDQGIRVPHLTTGENITLVFTVRVNEKVKKIDLGFSLHDQFGEMITYLYSGFQNIYYNGNRNQLLQIKCRLESFAYSNTNVILKGRIEADGIEADWVKDPIAILEIKMGDFYKTGKTTNLNIPYLIKGQWK